MFVNNKGRKALLEKKEDVTNATDEQGNWKNPVVLKPHMEVTPCIETKKTKLIKQGKETQDIQGGYTHVTSY